MDQLSTSSYNPFEPGFVDDPYPAYARMRADEPVHRSPLGIWLLFAHDDVARLLKDAALSVDERHMTATPLRDLVKEIQGDRADRGQYSMLRRDPPDHTRLRKLVTKAFTPRMLEGLRPMVARLADELLDAAGRSQTFDVITDLAFPLPFTVISRMLGVPAEHGETLREWSGLLVRTLEPLVDPALIRAIADASDNMVAFLTDMIEWKRAHPGDDVFTALLQAEENGDVLSDHELLEQVMLLYIAGHETTVNLIGNGTLALLRNRAQIDRFVATPETGIEELLRYDSPVQMSRRIARRDLQVGGRTIDEGSFIVLVLASANRDESRWGSTAASLDCARADAQHHQSFGGGVHYCLGAALARMEGKIAIEAMLRRYPAMRQDGDIAWNGRLNLRGLERLPVRV